MLADPCFSFSVLKRVLEMLMSGVNQVINVVLHADYIVSMLRDKMEIAVVIIAGQDTTRMDAHSQTVDRQVECHQLNKAKTCDDDT